MDNNEVSAVNEASYSQELTALYDIYNQRYFGASLPPRQVKVVRGYGRSPDGDGYVLAGLNDEATGTIVLTSTLDWLMRGRLIHEMCHVGTDGRHDHDFLRRLWQIAALDDDADYNFWAETFEEPEQLAFWEGSEDADDEPVEDEEAEDDEAVDERANDAKGGDDLNLRFNFDD